MPKTKCNTSRWPTKIGKRTKRAILRRKKLHTNSVIEKLSIDENIITPITYTPKKQLFKPEVSEYVDQPTTSYDKNERSSSPLFDLEEAWISREELTSISEHSLIVERDPNPPAELNFEKTLKGNRIVNLGYVLQWAINLQYNHSKKCTLGILYPFKETNRGLGLVSYIEFRCTVCTDQIVRSTENPNTVPSEINTGCVWGTISTGSTYAHTEELLASMNIPPMNKYTFYKMEKELETVWYNQIWIDMEKAGEEERNLAIEKNDVDSDGVPFITVYLDGGWSKRSYGHNYNAASGVAVIIGKQTGKVLFMGVRNKYCSICVRAANKNVTPKEHKCYRNWSGSSSAMEADIIVQGFCVSEEHHKLRYEYFIADGDSSVFAKIRKEVPYQKFIKKIECTNHAIKNYGKALHRIKADTKNITLAARTQLKKAKIEELTKIAQSAIYNCSYERNINSLKEDLKNGPFHVFGDHMKCKDYYCTMIGTVNNNIVPEIKKTGLYNHITAALEILEKKSGQLISNETNNRAELFMSILARFNAGKRLNLTNRGSFQTRCYLSGMRYNKGIEWHSSPYKKYTSQSPGVHFKKYISKSKRDQKRKPVNRVLDEIKQTKNKLPNIDYGPKALQPDITEEEAEWERTRILEKLQVTKEEQIEIAKNSIGQFGNPVYEAERCDRLTASVFGKVVKRRQTTSCHNLVKEILYTAHISTPAIEYGKSKESVAIALFQNKMCLEVKPCGLYVDVKHGFLGASPDGIIDDKYLVEVKCLHKAANSGWSLQKTAESNKTCLEMCGKEIRLKRNHDYYFQIQGQLNIVDKQICYFIVYINDNEDLFIEKIEKDENLWNNCILPQLTAFYFDCILPELIYKRIPRGLKCKDPEYITEAQEKSKAKGKTKKTIQTNSSQSETD